MTKNPYIDRHMLNSWREQSKRIESLVAAPSTLADGLHPITLARVAMDADDSYKGYMASQDGRIILRFVDDIEAQEKFGVLGATTQECMGLVFRLGNLKSIEDAAMDAQKEVVALRRALTVLTGPLSRGEMPPQRSITDAVITLRNAE